MNKLKLLWLGLIFTVTQSVSSNKIYAQSKADSIYTDTSAINIVNTIWSGIDSDGDFYEYTFLENGKISYKTNTSRTDTVQFNDDEDIWFQNQNNIVILLGKTSVSKGIISKDKIVGTAWNINGRRWTWECKKK